MFFQARVFLVTGHYPNWVNNALDRYALTGAQQDGAPQKR